MNFPQLNGHSIWGYHRPEGVFYEQEFMSKRVYKTYTSEFKLEAIRLAEESDKPVAQVARGLGFRENIRA